MFNTLTDKQIEKIILASQIVSETMRVLQKSESNIVGEILKTAEKFYEWEHLPPNDVYDTSSHSQYYFHAHSKSSDGSGLHDDEHGHFHTFIRGKAMPESIKPLPLNGYDHKTDIGNINTHIIGIGMNNNGIPIRLFTVNRWVTGETWFRAEDILKIIDLYEIDDTRPSWAVNLWISNMIILFQPIIKELIFERDQTIEQWKNDHPEVDDVYEDRNLEVTSFRDINLADYVDQLSTFIEN